MGPFCLDRYRGFLVDIDGVLLRGTQPIGGSIQALAHLQQCGPTVLLSNNSTRSRADLAAHLTALGFTVSPEHALVSSSIAAEYLLATEGRTAVWCFGEEGLRSEVLTAGHTLAPAPHEAAWVVAGMDRHLTYQDLTNALHALRSGARLLATNTDATYPTTEGLIPGAGAIIGALTGMGYPPAIVVGKPSKIAFDVALLRLGLAAGDALMIGDRIDTDIVGARDAGIHTALLLSGVTGRQELIGDNKPTWVANDLTALVRGDALAGGAAFA